MGVARGRWAAWSLQNEAPAQGVHWQACAHSFPGDAGQQGLRPVWFPFSHKAGETSLSGGTVLGGPGIRPGQDWAWSQSGSADGTHPPGGHTEWERGAAMSPGGSQDFNSAGPPSGT